MVVSPGLAGITPRRVTQTRTQSDRLYRRIATGAGLATLAILALIGVFLLVQSWPAIQRAGWSFWTTSKWQPDGLSHQFGIDALLYWTVTIAVVALIVAVPVSIACALFINEYAPPRSRPALRGLIDLLAAIPSVIYGVVGFIIAQPQIVAVSHWLTANLGGIPVFSTINANYAGSAFVVGIVVSLMVIPICTSVMREVFAQTPPGEKEAALALGATRWGMIRAVVLPFGRGGIVGGAMLGMGRALGETIAVALIVSPIFTLSPHILQSGANSIAAHIALQFSDASPQLGVPALLYAGLTLFAFTLIINFLASIVVARSRSGKGVDA